jgi:SAM-dependent methyltransferase
MERHGFEFRMPQMRCQELFGQKWKKVRGLRREHRQDRFLTAGVPLDIKAAYYVEFRSSQRNSFRHGRLSGKHSRSHLLRPQGKEVSMRGLRSAIRRLFATIDPYAKGDANPLPPCPYFVDLLDYTAGVFSLSGWLFFPEHTLDGFRVHLNGKAVGGGTLTERDDVAKTFPFHPEARRCAFRLEVPVSMTEFTDWARVEVFGLIQGKDAVRLRTVYRPDYAKGCPEPPEELRWRVTHSRNLNAFWNSGIQTFGEFHRFMMKHCRPAGVRRLLDWGCGCGRVSMFYVKYLKNTEVHGCDVDPEAVAWCAQNIRPGQFTCISLMPPTPYPDNTFDVVTGCSIFTHLTRQAQFGWLNEIKRILVPGGLFLASVHGTTAQLSAVSPQQRLEIVRWGFCDANPDPTLRDILPASYYRATLQDKEYTCREFGWHLRVIDYVEGEMSNRQDLVIMKKEGQLANRLAFARPIRGLLKYAQTLAGIGVSNNVRRARLKGHHAAAVQSVIK